MAVIGRVAQTCSCLLQQQQYACRPTGPAAAISAADAAGMGGIGTSGQVQPGPFCNLIAAACSLAAADATALLTRLLCCVLGV